MTEPSERLGIKCVSTAYLDPAESAYLVRNDARLPCKSCSSVHEFLTVQCQPALFLEGVDAPIALKSKGAEPFFAERAQALKERGGRP